ncbi:DUF6798 domain-containing protein [Alienimonas chondri]|uniref:DUF6798 domain-containing protein n=1 Tax=Alienimonas chondri TaxID=2681879 RepID=A0ABX1VFN5_9PLAN|nr:DUF6798 domain-containing protein [Alienimonas chondri]NNJ26907.1 hypothetical protein [Alienimonas chondri]
MQSAAAGTLLFGTLIAYSLVQSPIPGVNEPQYLGKALHLVDPTYCPGDFFLDSSDPHGVFGLLCGPVAERFDLATAALFGRVLGLALLACGWTMTARRTLGTAWAAPISGAAFLAAAAAGNLSGEWLVGGAEGKVFSYGALLIAFAWAVDRRWALGAAAAGVAVSFHPVVGVWGVGCGAFAAVVLAVRRLRRNEPIGRPGWGTTTLAAVGFLLCAAPGLWFALDALEAAPGVDIGRANFLQVYLRLPHHLDPMTFRTPAWIGFLHLTFVWAVLRRWGARSSEKAAAAESTLALTVLGSLIVAYVGVLIGLRTGEPHEATAPYFRAFLLKFYPFRLADVLVPLAASLAVAGVAARFARSAPRALGVGVAGVGLFVLALWIPFYDRDPAGLTDEEAADWRTMCAWIDASLPADAEVVTPTRNHAFKWYAKRAEYVCFKDCPQDAAGILEWNRRLRILRTWAGVRYGDDAAIGYDQAELAELGVATEADYLLTMALGPIDAAPTHVAGAWRLYRLRSAPAE